jgi:hypothetical protein
LKTIFSQLNNPWLWQTIIETGGSNAPQIKTGTIQKIAMEILKTIATETEAATKVAMGTAIGIVPIMDKEVLMAKEGMIVNMITTAVVVSKVMETIIVLNAVEVPMEVISMTGDMDQVHPMDQGRLMDNAAHLIMELADMVPAPDMVDHHMEVATAQVLVMAEEACMEAEAVDMAPVVPVQEEVKDTVEDSALESEAIWASEIMAQASANHNEVMTIPALTDQIEIVPEMRIAAGGKELPMRYHHGLVMKMRNADVVRTASIKVADRRITNVQMSASRRISMIA